MDRLRRDAAGPRPCPASLRGLIKMLGEYQALAAEAAWRGTRIDGVRALAATPSCSRSPRAETLYDEMAAALRQYLPHRLLH